ncbi:glyoxalase [Nocardia donostiensis]|uniref:glyoxalase n=1 Tax=Nocardia donostiensis TaxID=1538463 RepID=UPI0009D931DF|nr:glyoxalase [Nocardia donostiensis]OQS15796.1 glyoxalase [Nocardia donostiensis]
MGDTAVPVLPSTDLGRTLDFFRALGYTVTHEQTKPYVYGAIEANDCALHFTSAPKDAPASDGQAGCLVMVDDVASRHRSFTEALRTRYGKVPASGPARITRFRSGQTRFSVIDPDGNWLTYIQRDEPEELEYGGSRELDGLARVIDNARILREFKNDDKSATRALEAGLRRFGAAATTLDRARALAALLELAVATEDSERAAARRADLAALELTESERSTLTEELSAADGLTEWLSGTS